MGAVGTTRVVSARSIRRMETAGAFMVVALGVPLHFVYGWSDGSRIVAVIAPVNESVWEHLKLVAVPVVLLGLVETTRLADRSRLWLAKVVEVAVAGGFIVAFFYTYTGAFGVDSIAGLDIGSFFVAVAIGQWTSYRLLASSRRPGVPLRVSALAMTLVVVGFAVLTFVPPHIPLFREASTGTYGPA